jgi:D-alanyl-D-alanine carboxypeptidase (penicillin-binding protein 5/6)
MRVFNFLFKAVLLGMPMLLFAKPVSINVSAKAAILINADSGKVLFSKKPDDRLPPGSTTKIASCLLALSHAPDFEEEINCPLECLIQIPQKIKVEHKYQDPPYRLEPDGKSYAIAPGEKLTIRDLMYAMMLHSANDASNVIAYRYSQGNIENYMKEVNDYLQTIGCKDTAFYNPHGLHYPKHLTTARDLATLGREAIKNPQLLEIVKTTKYERPRTNKYRETRTVWNGNKLLLKGPYYYPKAFGIKTGFHSAAGFSFVGAARDDHRTLIAVVLKCANYAEAFKDTIKMFDTAFGEKQLSRQLLNHQDSMFTTKVKGSKTSLQASLQEDLIVHYFPSEEEELKPHLEWHVLKLPIKKGQQVGEVQVKTEEGNIVKVAPLYAMEDLKKSLFSRSKMLLFSFSSAICVGVVILISRYYRREKLLRAGS